MIHIVPILQDNYAYLIETGEGRCICVDPGEAEPVLQAADHLGLSIKDLINTHHDWDHVDGNEAVKRQTGCTIWAPNHPAINVVDRPIESEDTVMIQGVEIHPLKTPGHQTHDLSYYLPGEKAVFCGDLLMVGGCGRIFTGDAQLMWSSIQTLMRLPDETNLYCGHEYTKDNYRFAVTQSEDPIYTHRLQSIEGKTCTVPSSIGEEKRSNIFVRSGGVNQFKQLRRAKDRF